MTQLQRDFSSVPLHAFFLESLTSLATIQPAQAAADSVDVKSPTHPVEIFARSADPLYHWWWGYIVHDMAGFKAPNQSMIDWCHDYDETLGFLDQFEASNAGLRCLGKIIPFLPTDRATEVVHKASHGVKWQASIDWSGEARIEELTAGVTVSVNGFDFTGPGFVVREWTLPAVAVCPHGQDINTETRFAKSSKAKHFPVTVFGGRSMSAVPTSPALPASKMFSADELAKWTKEFGAESGIAYLTDGLSWDAALHKHAVAQHAKLNADLDELRKQLTAKDDSIAQLSKQLEAAKKLSEGEAPPAGGAESTGDSKKGFIKLSSR